MQKDPKDLRIAQYIAYIVLIGFFAVLVPIGFYAVVSSSEKKPLSNGCPIFYTSSQHGDINLPVGTIFGYPAESGENLYDIIRDDTFIMSNYFKESFKRDFKCFKTEEEAVAAGYTKFLTDQAARKKRREEAKERLDKSREDTNTAELLNDIDAVIGL
ncbi:MAG: hypothetical protein Q8R55_05135 [Candidatus Taylorbacteria bacterium]|nr:hypothetical protein [Candidatus Taylorbacteria bacterium]